MYMESSTEYGLYTAPTARPFSWRPPALLLVSAATLLLGSHAFPRLAALNAVPAPFVYDYCQAPPPHMGGADNLQLVRMAVVARHGDRSPLVKYVGRDSYNAWGDCERCKSSGLWDSACGGGGACYVGQLTDKGQDQLRAVGRAIRNAFEGHGTHEARTRLGKRGGVSVLATHVNRTQDSARALLEGLLGSASRAADVSIEVQQPGEKLWLYPSRGCDGLASADDAAMRAWGVAISSGSPPVAHWALGEKMDGDGSLPAAQLLNLNDLYQTRWCHGGFRDGWPCEDTAGPSYDGTACDHWALTHFATVVETVQDTTCAAGGGSSAEDDRRALRLIAGRLLHEVSTFVELGKPHAAVRYFSGHDSTLVPLLSALGLWGGKAAALWPPYASTVAFEVWADVDGAETVRVRYNGLEVFPPLMYGDGEKQRETAGEKGGGRLSPAETRHALRGLSMGEHEWFDACGVPHDS